MYNNEQAIYRNEEKESLNAFFVKTFKWMFLGLFITAITGLLTVQFVPANFFQM